MDLFRERYTIISHWFVSDQQVVHEATEKSSNPLTSCVITPLRVSEKLSPRLPSQHMNLDKDFTTTHQTSVSNSAETQTDTERDRERDIEREREIHVSSGWDGARLVDLLL